jgi:hypothetical protein
MKELTTAQQEKVIKLFLQGDTYDQISTEANVAKGSVVNIIEAFRNGAIGLPAGTVEYVDELRHLVVDMKKQQTNVAQLKEYLPLHHAVEQAGVDAAHAGNLLAVCQQAAVPTIEGKQFFHAAMVLAQVTADTGKNYEEVLGDYADKHKKLDTLDNEIKLQQKTIANLKAAHSQEIAQYNQNLNSLSQAIKTAQAAFSQLQADLKSQRDVLIWDHQLTIKKVNTAAAVLQDKLGQTGLGKNTIQEVADRITETGSLILYRDKLTAGNKEEESRKNNLQVLNGKLESRNKELQDSVDSLIKTQSQLNSANTMEQIKYLALKNQANTILNIIAEQKELFTAACCILGFLLSPEDIENRDFDNLMQLISDVQQYRDKLNGKNVKNARLHTIVEFSLPPVTSFPNYYGVAYEQARKTLALCLVKLVKSEFLSKDEQNEILLNNIISNFKNMYNHNLPQIINSRSESPPNV